jgi:hypothetical protein
MLGITRAGALVLVAMLAGGCGGSPTMSSGPAPPHQGHLITLPGGKGYVEVVKKDAASTKAALTAEESFYFLKEGATPLSPAPSGGIFTVGTKTVTLQSEGDALITPNGPPLLPKGGLDGVLAVELNGQAIKIPVGVR